MKIKTTYIIGALLLAAIIAMGYFLYLQQQKLPEAQLTKFEYYAEKTLGLSLQQFSSCLDSMKYRADVQNDLNEGQSYGVDGTPTFFVNGRMLVGAQPLSEFKKIIDEELANPTENEIKTGKNPLRGSSNATVTIVEFSDFQCPYCARVESTIKQILQQYEGKVKIYYRDFPLSGHAFSQQAAEASRCAGEQGKYWEYHDILFDKQQEWSAG